MSCVGQAAPVAPVPPTQVHCLLAHAILEVVVQADVWYWAPEQEPHREQVEMPAVLPPGDSQLVPAMQVPQELPVALFRR